MVHSSAGIKSICIKNLFAPPTDWDAKRNIVITRRSERNQSKTRRFWKGWGILARKQVYD